MAKYGETIYLPGKDAALSAVTGMQGGVDGGVNDGSTQAPE